MLCLFRLAPSVNYFTILISREIYIAGFGQIAIHICLCTVGLSCQVIMVKD